MKKERLTKLAGWTAIIPVAIVSLSALVTAERAVAGQTYGAGPAIFNPSALTPDTPFSEAIDVLRNSTKPPLNIVVLWKDLAENAGIYRDTPIGMDGVSGISLRTHLELLLRSVSAGAAAETGYTVEKGVIIIATKDTLPNKRIARIYDITDLVSAPANYSYPGRFAGPYTGFYGGQPRGTGSYEGYGRAYGRTYGEPYRAGRGYGRRGSYRLNRANELTNLIETLYGSGGTNTYRNNRRTERTR